MHKLVIADPHNTELVDTAQRLCDRWGFKLTTTPITGLCLFLDSQKLSLKQLDQPKMGAVFVDFASDALTFRRLHSSGKKESIAKAVGVKGNQALRVLDATAGLGKDASILASLGCYVDMVERSSVAAALLSDGLQRALQHPELSQWLPQRMQLHHGSASDLLKHWQGEQPDVVYLDPMFPHRKKSAMVKKEMQLFQQLLGPDEDADQLLAPAMALASKRVVVKRPDVAPHLNNMKPDMAITGKKLRFDVYFSHNHTNRQEK